jgi:uncharacterized cupredoxin-like copper-binding protein
MIRLFIVIGIVGVALASYLATFGQGPDYQMSQAASLLKEFEAKGLIPAANDVVENEEVEHGVFDVPPEDEVELKKAMSMGGMKMDGMKMDGADDKNMPMAEGGKMPAKMESETAEKMPMNADGKMAINMDSDAAKKMPMAEEGKASTKMESKTVEKMPMNADGKMAMNMGGEKAQDGLKITEDGAFDREINLTMAEWKFSNMQLEVKSGEKIRFTITNDGKIPHEFMFMTMPAMQAITYRARRADWNLLEHEASFEKSLVLPGGKFSFVAEIQQNGVWMFMCMLPYHMQMGMMGQMATPGMAMDMQM